MTRSPDESSDEPERCCFDDWVDQWALRTKKKDTTNSVTSTLVDALSEAGLFGRTVLDVGCGIGDLAIATVARGATHATGFDLSIKAIEEARALARARGVHDRTTFGVGDGAKLHLPPADVVAVNRVVCCYPDADGLLDRTLEATGSVYAITAPISRGLTGAYNRAVNRFWNVWYRLRKKRFAGFRTFVHDVGRIDERVRAAGFRRIRHERRRIVWDLAVYAR